LPAGCRLADMGDRERGFTIAEGWVSMVDLDKWLNPAQRALAVDTRQKLQHLVDSIGQSRSVVVAFSGGVDSTFLAWACKAALGDKVLLVTAISETYPSFERIEAEELARNLGIRQQTIHTGELDNPHYSENPPDRCYFCKSELFRSILDLAKKEGYEAVFEGGNLDDLSDYRPGRRALKELKISSPLCDAKLTKAEIREISAAVGLTTASKPSYACLASRFPYGEHLDAAKLRRVETAESALRRMGFTQFRVRSHNNLARVELLPSEMEKGWAARDAILKACRDAGYIFVTIDLVGYRTGAMNEGLSEPL
jgi:pyridinium-3,5-biscarboxylic acid mononucleotide sulfurtransferase